MKTGRRTVWACVGALFIYALLTVALTWPVTAQMSSALAGGEKDTWINPWAIWWTRKALIGEERLYWTDYLFHPQGVSLVFHSFSHTNTSLALVLEPFIGIVAAQNATTLLAYALSGFSMFLLTDSLFHDRAAAMVAGLVFAFAPYHIDQASHPVINSTQWIPLFLLFFIRLLEEGRLRNALVAVLFLVATALTSWHLFLLTAMLAGFYLLGESLSARRQRRPIVTRALISFVILCLLLLGPLMWPQLREWFAPTTSYGSANVNEKPGKSADLLAFAIPTYQHPVWGEHTRDVQLGLLDQDHSLFLGVIAPIVALYGLLRNGSRAATRWLVIGGLFWILSLGPYPRVAGTRLPLLPWGVPLIKVFRVSHRFHTMTTLVFAVLVAWGWKSVWEAPRLRERWSCRAVSTILVGSAILFEYISTPIPTSSVRVSPFFQRLGVDSEDYAVIDLPLGRSYSRYYMFQQVFHEKRIAGGVVSRTPSRANDFLEAQPFWDSLLNDNEIDASLHDVSRQLRYLAQNDIRYLIIHPKRLHGDPLPEEQLTRWRDYFTIAPVYEDDLILVYPTEPRAGQDFEIGQRLGDGLGLIRASVEPKQINQGGTLFVDSRWGSEASVDEDLLVCLAMVDATGQRVQETCREPVSDWPTSEWMENTVGIGHYVLQVEPHLPAGEYTLSARTIDAKTESGPGPTAVLESITVDALQRSFKMPPVEQAVSGDFGQDLHLLGYDIALEGESLLLSLHWRARARMDTSYKFFVHLYSLSSGELKAQADVVPLDWTYPTTWWEEGEVVSDPITLPVSDLPKGNYTVAVGVYDPETGDRLPVVGHETTGNSISSLVLQEIALP